MRWVKASRRTARFCGKCVLAGILLLFVATGSPRAGAPDPLFPSDFRIVAAAGSVAPSHSLRTLEIEASGSAVFCRIPAARRGRGDCLTPETFTLTTDELNLVYQAVVDGDFFQQAPIHVGPAVDGTFAEFTITASGTTHTVRSQNIAVAAFDSIALAINSVVPGQFVLKYNAIAP